MSRFQAYLQSAQHLINTYDGTRPFAEHLKLYFRQHPKAGRTDRKTISQLCFGYYRAGRVFDNQPLPVQLLSGFLLTLHQPHPLLEALWPQWNAFAVAELTVKLQKIDPALLPAEFLAKLFPLQDQLSAEIDAQKFSQSILTQPRVFLRIRPGRKQHVLSSLDQSGIPVEELSAGALVVPADTRIPPALVPDVDFVVQDYNSQRVAELFPDWNSSQPIRVWDSCAGSGGKALLAADVYPNLNLTVTDKRKYILERLLERMAGVRSVQAYCVDLTDSASWPEALRQQSFDLVLADVPCSGSGTWARVPEQISFFSPSQLEAYVSLQRKILDQLVRQVEPGGNLLYVTCSVFQQENEGHVHYLLQKPGVHLLRQVYFKGYERGGDTLFAALFNVSRS